MSSEDEEYENWKKVWDRGVLERERWIGEDWEKVTEEYPDEQFVKYDYSEYVAKYCANAHYLVDGVERLVFEPFYFYAAAVEEPSQIDHVTIANAMELYYQNQKEYGDIHVVLCKGSATQEDIHRIYARYGHHLKGLREMSVDPKTKRIEFYMK